MVDAEVTMTETSRTQLVNLEIVTGTVTPTEAGDWVDVSSLTPPLQAPLYAHANLSADGVDGEAFVAPASNNKVVLTAGSGTGAMQIVIIAPSFESTGGD